jgi:hypothetical protein
MLFLQPLVGALDIHDWSIQNSKRNPLTLHTFISIERGIHPGPALAAKRAFPTLTICPLAASTLSTSEPFSSQRQQQTATYLGPSKSGDETEAQSRDRSFCNDGHSGQVESASQSGLNSVSCSKWDLPESRPYLPLAQIEAAVLQITLTSAPKDSTAGAAKRVLSTARGGRSVADHPHQNDDLEYKPIYY